MLGSVFEWYSSNTLIAYPFVERQADDLHKLLVDAYVMHNKMRTKAQRVRINQFDPAGVLQLYFEDDTVLAELTALDNFTSVEFGRYTIYRWTRTTTLDAGFTDDDIIATVVVLTEKLSDFSPPMSSTTAYLIDSLVNPRVKRVRRIGLALPGADCCVAFAGNKLILEAGNNMKLSLPSDIPEVGLNILTTDTTRKPRRILFDAIPGAGAGKFNNCSAADNPIRTVNATGPDTNGNFNLVGKDCTWVEQRIATLSEDPPFPSTDYRIESMVDATLQLHQNCVACCDCTDYKNAYELLAGQWSRLQAASARYATILAQYKALREELLAAFCKGDSGLVLKLKLVARPDFYMSVLVLAYNNTQENLHGCGFSFLFDPAGWEIVPGSGLLNAEGFRDIRIQPSGALTLSFPKLSKGKFAKYSFELRYTEPRGSRQDTTVHCSAVVEALTPTNADLNTTAVDSATLISPLEKS